MKMLLYKQKKNQNVKGNRLLISINVLGSAGPIRFIVSEEQLVADVIDTALKSYAREGRLPILGSDLHHFQLYCPSAGPDALSPWDTIGSHGARNFTLCKKPQAEKVGEDGKAASRPAIHRKASGSWKSWINKSLNMKIYSH
ncbi:uncharacterized protein At4g22758 [Cucurbita maxima]|uniref:Uncharacterized protein At4g22758 n=1 Tax=Cucurbita maxima TaxID=3661 RepID=A0A6J1JP66_CUCMA|nr:uncharacterized protein At4g22758 [Cucurbita maxima]